MTYRALLLGIALPILTSCTGAAPHAGQPTQQAASMRQMRADIEVVRAYIDGRAKSVRCSERCWRSCQMVRQDG
jgi:hypothetical protein